MSGLVRAVFDEGRYFVECPGCCERTRFYPDVIYSSTVTHAPERCEWCGDAFVYDYDVRTADADRTEQLRADIELISGRVPTVAEHVAFPFGVWLGGALVGLGRDEADALHDAVSTLRRKAVSR